VRFATPAAAIEALAAAFGPDDDDWRVAPGTFGLLREPAGAPAHIKRFHGPLLRTMHFGLVTLDLETGALTFIDEDHRDGGDYVRRRATLPAEWLEAVRAVPW
jgi:hypothetical protein